MAGESHDAVIAYDIGSNRTRRRVLRVLREWRLDGQKSVHECRLSRRMAEELFMQLCAEVDPGKDRLLLAWIRRGGSPYEHAPKPAGVYRVD